jgi:16S rRNA G966 N2-methylase RsmD
MAQRAKLIYKPNNYIGLRNKNLLFHCDNLDCVNYLLKHGFENKIDLVYIDPPFLSGERYLHRVKNNSNLALKMYWKKMNILR